LVLKFRRKEVKKEQVWPCDAYIPLAHLITLPGLALGVHPDLERWYPPTSKARGY